VADTSGLAPTAGTGESAEVTISSVIRVDLSVLAAAEEDYRRVLYALEAQLDQLDAELGAHLGEWSGDARAAFDVAHAQWRAAADDMAQTLAWLGGVIRTARANYESARTTNMRIWRGR
jgi:WXG100 family type VII secretion target